MSSVLHRSSVVGVTLLLAGSPFETLEAAYIIKLNNGNEYVTSRYWKDGGQVLFDTYGGVFGVDKSLVSAIEKSDKSSRAPTVDREPVKKPPSPSKNTDSAETRKRSRSNTEKQRASDDPIVAEFNDLKEKSKQVGGMLTSEIRNLLGEIKAYKNKLTRNSKLFVEYGREFNELHEIGARVENALRSRAQ